MVIRLTSAFDSGNINVLDADDPAAIRLEIRKDHQSDFYQWFHYRVTGAAGTPLSMIIENAAGAAYPLGWADYQAVASYDRDDWFRVPTDYADGKLTINHEPLADSVYYAYFAPHSMERHHDLIANAQLEPDVSLEVLGHTLDGQAMDLLTVGTIQEGKKSFWVTARQHPGETMGGWWMEGFLDRLFDSADPVARKLRDKAVFYIVPNMNPDGSKRGHLRTNAVGTNLNREWANPTMEKSPEVFLVRNKMHETGVDFALDVHGDEALPYNFIAGGEGAPNFNNKIQALLDRFKNALKVASPDFQTVHGYPIDAPRSANLTTCTNAITNEFTCLAMTLEMPFKDTADTPDPQIGWSPARASNLGAACLDAMLAIADDIR